MYDFRSKQAASKPVKVLQQGVKDSQLSYMREGMRSLQPFLDGYAGATPDEVELIATGKLKTKNSSRPFEPIRIDAEPSGKGFHFEVSGRHRLQAAKMMGAKHIVVNVHEQPSGKVYENIVIPVPR